MNGNVFETAHTFEEAWRENITSRDWRGRVCMKLPFPCLKLIQHQLQFQLDLRCLCTTPVKKRKGVVAETRKWACECGDCGPDLRVAVVKKVASVKAAIQDRIERCPTTIFVLALPELTAMTFYKRMDVVIRLLEVVPSAAPG